MSSLFLRWARDNLFLVGALLLPLLLIAAFAMARILPQSLIPDPQYDLIVARFSPHYDSGSRFRFDIEKGRLTASYSPREKNRNDRAEADWAELIVYRGGTVQDTIRLEPPAGLKATTKLPLRTLADKTVSKNERAPDGYRFEPYTSRNGSSLVLELFDYDRHGSRPALVKDGRRIILKQENAYYAPKFIGWIAKP
jgi:hypothetical protein